MVGLGRYRTTGREIATSRNACPIIPAWRISNFTEPVTYEMP